MKPTEDEYVRASEERIRDWCSSCGVVISDTAWVAIHAELKIMFEAGEENGRNNNSAKFDKSS